MNKRQLIANKIFNRGSIPHLCAGWRLKGEKIVFTNGCFDLLHKGHIDSLLQAAEMGNRLVVGLNSDASVRRQAKGPERPLLDEIARSWNLAAQTFVDAVVIFDEDTPELLIQQVKPDVLAKGGDYTPEQIAGASFVQSYGGEVRIIPITAGYSTTALVAKARKQD
jgi:rfaE bifunctional protein nucleotidyltransferase chain/domain